MPHTQWSFVHGQMLCALELNSGDVRCVCVAAGLINIIIFDLSFILASVDAGSPQRSFRALRLLDSSTAEQHSYDFRYQLSGR